MTLFRMECNLKVMKLQSSGILTLVFSDYSGAAESEPPNRNHANGQILN